MKVLKTMVVWAAIFFSAALSYGADKTFPVGALFPMSGPQAFYGRVMSRGAQMAVHHLNSSGGVEGYKLKLIITDFKNIDTSAGVSGTQKMIRMDKIPFVLVSFSAVILGARPVCEAAHVLMLNPGAYRELEEKGIRTVYEAISLVPGINTHINTMGDKQVSVRGLGGGFFSGNLKLMTDGIVMNDALNASGYAIYNVPVRQIDRIEIIRGSRFCYLR